MNGDPLLSIRDLEVWRGEAHVLHGVTFAVIPGRVTALLGRNGVGKTTTLLAILGLLPARGSIRMNGREMLGEPTHLVVQRGIGFVPEDREVFFQLTVAENLRLAERGESARYESVYHLFPDLAARKDQVAGTLSGGQQQMVALARALLNPNQLLLIDEPTKGLAPRLVEELMGVLQGVVQDTSILLVEQNMTVAARLATEAVVLDQGQVVYTGPMAALADDADLASRYLGVAVR